ncbi:hypothetical protein GCM10009862_19490 [Microbacterium binotii]|uniref:Secreted protein n=1 Tax=Microbacterium binotii TaxID=462710 RepID=A0ABP6BSJ5_9MICO
MAGASAMAMTICAIAPAGCGMRTVRLTNHIPHSAPAMIVIRYEKNPPSVRYPGRAATPQAAAQISGFRAILRSRGGFFAVSAGWFTRRFYEVADMLQRGL